MNLYSYCQEIFLNTSKVTEAGHSEFEDEHSIKSWCYILNEPLGYLPSTNNAIEDSMLNLRYLHCSWSGCRFMTMQHMYELGHQIAPDHNAPINAKKLDFAN